MIPSAHRRRLLSSLLVSYSVYFLFIVMSLYFRFLYFLKCHNSITESRHSDLKYKSVYFTVHFSYNSNFKIITLENVK